MEKGNSQCEHGQPMEQTRSLFCTCDSGVAHFQSQHQYHFWRMSATVRSVLHGQVSLEAVNQICVIHEAMNGCNNLMIIKGLLRKCKYNTITYMCQHYVRSSGNITCVRQVMSSYIWQFSK